MMDVINIIVCFLKIKVINFGFVGIKDCCVVIVQWISVCYQRVLNFIWLNICIFNVKVGDFVYKEQLFFFG